MELKALSLNLWQGGRLLREALEYIRKENPDIVALQEVYHGADADLPQNYRSLEMLRAELMYPYDAFAPTFLEVTEFGEIEQGNAVLSRFPITAQESRFFDVPYGKRVRVEGDFSLTPRNIQCVTIQAQHTTIAVANTQGIWGVHGSMDNERRLRMAHAIVEFTKDIPNLILTGDFNVRPNTETIAFIERNFKNVFKNRLKTTFNRLQKTNPIFAEIVVDMMFVSPDIEVIESACPAVNISDHLPLVARLLIQR